MSEKVKTATETIFPGDSSEVDKVVKVAPDERWTKTLRPFQSDGTPRTYLLHYGFSNVPNLFKAFVFDGDIKQASLRGRKHCQLMNYRFHVVTPFIVDLELQEQLFIDRQERQDGIKSPWE